MALSLEILGTGGPVYGPAVPNACPGIVILHGAEGPGAGWSHRFAAILAAHGFLAAPHAYGEGDVFGAGRIVDVDLAEVPGAGRALAAHPACSGRVGLLGWSKGAEAALLVAGLDSDPFACVAVHAPPVQVTEAFDPADRALASEARQDAPRAWRWEGHDDALAPGTPLPVEALTIPLLVSSGTCDDVIDHAEARGVAARVPGARLEVFEGQGHALEFAVEPKLWAALTGFFGMHLGAKS